MSENNIFLGQQAAEMIAHGINEQIDKHRINYQLTSDGAGISISGGFGNNALVPGAVIYDTKEQVIGCWINGKPIYQKIFSPDSWSYDSSTQQYYIDIDDLNLENLLDFRHFHKNIDVQGSDQMIVYGSFTEANNVRYGLWVKYINNVCYLRCYTINLWPPSQGYTVIQYTKTTDEENSFNSNMLSSSAVNNKHSYSTEERIVGTWIDGSSIYEKTFVFDGTNETETVDVGTLGIKDLIDSKTSCLIEIDGSLIPEITTDTDSHIRSSKDGFWNGYAHYAAHLFNGYQGTEAGSWGVNGVSDASGHYVIYQFDYPVVPKKCSIQNYKAYSTNGMFQFQFSKDDESWTTLGDIVSGKSYTNAGELVCYEFDNEEEYSYFRFLVTGSLADTSGYITVDSVQVYGKAKIRASLHDNVYLGFDKLIISGNQKMVKYATIQYTKN